MDRIESIFLILLFIYIQQRKAKRIESKNPHQREAVSLFYEFFFFAFFYIFLF